MEHFDLELFRRDVEPMARRLIELCEPDWFSNLLCDYSENDKFERDPADLF